MSDTEDQTRTLSDEREGSDSGTASTADTTDPASAMSTETAASSRTPCGAACGTAEPEMCPIMKAYSGHYSMVHERCPACKTNDHGPVLVHYTKMGFVMGEPNSVTPEMYSMLAEHAKCREIEADRAKASRAYVVQRAAQMLDIKKPPSGEADDGAPNGKKRKVDSDVSSTELFTGIRSLQRKVRERVDALVTENSRLRQTDGVKTAEKHEKLTQKYQTLDERYKALKGRNVELVATVTETKEQLRGCDPVAVVELRRQNAEMRACLQRLVAELDPAVNAHLDCDCHQRMVEMLPPGLLQQQREL
jgi:hypothetical protein